MQKSSPHKSKTLRLIFDRNILVYAIIMILHVIASALVSNLEWKAFFGNLLFYLPSDVLLILVYKGIVKD